MTIEKRMTQILNGKNVSCGNI